MIEFSKKRIARARDEKVTPQQLAVAELMAWGWDAQDAMLAIGIIKQSDDPIDAQHAAVNFTATEDFTTVYKKRVKQLRNGAVTDDLQKLHPTPGTLGANRGRKREDGGPENRKVWQGDLDAPATDEEILAAMWETITKLEPKDPKRVDLLDKYDKLKRRQGIGEDDTTIHFYLPRPECDSCPFRGNHVITEPEALAKNGVEAPEEEEPEPEAKPGYFPSGKKIGRPPKPKRAKKPKKPGRKPKKKPQEEL